MMIGILPDLEVPFRKDSSDAEKYARREEDLYLNALPAVNQARQQRRPGELGVLKKCVSEKVGALPEAASAKGKDDNQMLYAQEVLNCSRWG